MTNKYKLIIVAAALAITPLLTFGEPILSSNDFIIAIDTNAVMQSCSRTPDSGNEDADKILDGDSSTKYLNFGGVRGWDALYTGFIVTPDGGSSTIQSFMLTTANDSDERDPSYWALHGTLDTITSTNNSTGTEENWTLIEHGTVALPTARETDGPVVQVINSTAYTSYRMVFPALRDGHDDIMQVADAAFYSTTNGAGANILSATDAIIAVQTAPASCYPSGEAPTVVIDGNVSNKYLNFGKENSGFIVTPAVGSSVVRAFQIWTANDFPGRDPTNWALYGTTDAIASTDNSQGTAESWTLIDSGYITLPADRYTASGMVPVDNSTAYTSYKMFFPEVKDPNGFDIHSMQIAEIQFDNVPEPAALVLLSLGGLAFLCRKRG